MTTRMIRAGLILAAMGAAFPAPGGAKAESTGTSCADCPSYSGAFSIRNETGQAIKYQYRWGDHHEWKRMTLATGHIETHSYPLGEDSHARVPTPFVRFDDTANDGQVTFREYRIHFHAIGYAGYGPAVNRTEPKRYVFRYDPSLRHLDLKAE